MQNKKLIIVAVLAAIAVLMAGSLFLKKYNPGNSKEMIWIALGDSITAGCDEDNNSYVDYICREHSELECYKKGIIGYSMVDLYDNRVKMLKDVEGLDVDVITVFAGTNDFGFNITPEKTKKACDAYMKYLKKSYPDSKIVFITPMYRDYSGELAGVSGQTNNIKCNFEEYVNIIIECGKENGIEVLNLYAKYYLNSDNIHEMTMDGLHPNREINKKLASLIWEEVLNN